MEAVEGVVETVEVVAVDVVATAVGAMEGNVNVAIDCFTYLTGQWGLRMHLSDVSVKSRKERE